jgi:hypothetical protein
MTLGVDARFYEDALTYPHLPYQVLIFLIGIVKGGIQLGPLDTAATNRRIVPAPGDYDGGEIGGMMIGRGNRITQRKPAPVPPCPPQTPHVLPRCEPGPPWWGASD